MVFLVEKVGKMENSAFDAFIFTKKMYLCAN